MKNEVDNVLLMNELLDVYGELLSPKQGQIFIDYYEDNLSLSEIAENLSISRNAVYDALKKAEASLKYYEEKLHVIENNNKLSKDIEVLYKEKHLDEVAFKVLKGE